MLSKALEMGVCFLRDPVLGNMGERSFRRAFDGRVRFFLSVELFWGIRETRKRRLWNRATLSIGAPFGEHVGGSFTGTFEEKMKDGSGNGVSLMKLIWASFLWIQNMLGARVWGQSGTSGMTRAPLLGIRIWGTRGLF